jgi:hypothetical protein
MFIDSVQNRMDHTTLVRDNRYSLVLTNHTVDVRTHLLLSASKLTAS